MLFLITLTGPRDLSPGLEVLLAHSFSRATWTAPPPTIHSNAKECYGHARGISERGEKDGVMNEG